MRDPSLGTGPEETGKEDRVLILRYLLQELVQKRQKRTHRERMNDTEFKYLRSDIMTGSVSEGSFSRNWTTQ